MSDIISAPPPEFSRVVRADRVQGREVVELLEATAAERQALARRLELQEIGRLTATIRLARVRGGQMIRVRGALEAEVVQTCVVTLEPVPAAVTESFGALFAPPDLVPDEIVAGELAFDPDVEDEDVPEPMQDGRIDLGELVAQHLSLALDPYPRAPGAAFEEIDEEAEEPAAAESAPEQAGKGPTPFAALAKLKRPN